MNSVGIHVDSRKIRIIEVNISAKKVTLLNAFEMDRGGDDALSLVLSNYFNTTSPKPDRVVASVGNTPVVTKIFPLPFRDRSKVQQAILGEFEDSLPVEIENFVLEFQPLAKKDGMHEFIGALISREPLEDMNQVFERIDVLPSDFLIPSEALGRLGIGQLAIDFAPGTVVCFCDIGFDSSQVAVVQYPKQSHLYAVRTQRK